jgi:hypothetical protein
MLTASRPKYSNNYPIKQEIAQEYQNKIHNSRNNTHNNQQTNPKNHLNNDDYTTEKQLLSPLSNYANHTY